MSRKRSNHQQNPDARSPYAICPSRLETENSFSSSRLQQHLYIVLGVLGLLLKLARSSCNYQPLSPPQSWEWKRTHQMITQRHKEIKPQPSSATPLHLLLHSPRPLKSLPRPDDQSQIMCPQFRITFGRICIRIPCASQYSAHTDPALKPLFPQRQPLQVRQIIPISGTIHQSIFQ